MKRRRRNAWFPGGKFIQSAARVANRDIAYINRWTSHCMHCILSFQHTCWRAKNTVNCHTAGCRTTQQTRDKYFITVAQRLNCKSKYLPSSPKWWWPRGTVYKTGDDSQSLELPPIEYIVYFHSDHTHFRMKQPRSLSVKWWSLSSIRRRFQIELELKVSKYNTASEMNCIWQVVKMTSFLTRNKTKSSPTWRCSQNEIKSKARQHDFFSTMN